MEEPDARVALDLLQLLVVADGPDAVALREDASTALRLLAKRLPEAGSLLYDPTYVQSFGL